MPPISASEAISPAFERVRQICFRPFRLGRWAKLAIVTLFTGEIASQGCSFRSAFPGGPHPTPAPAPMPSIPPGAAMGLLVLVPIILLFVAILVFVFTHLWCRFRFTLIDTVLTGECRIRESWEKYRSAGWRMFWFYLIASLVPIISGIWLIGIPLIRAAQAGVFRTPGAALKYFLGVGLVLLFFFAVLLVLFALMVVFLKDFVAPVLALEDAPLSTAWERVKNIASADPGAFVIYILMKIVLTIAAGIIFGIITFFMVLIVLIPIVIIAVAIGMTMHSAGGSLANILSGISAPQVLLFLLLALLCVAGVIYLVSFISVPAAIFFESYALYFFGSRYEPLGRVLIPQPSPAPYPVIPPQTPPDYIPPVPGMPGTGPEPA